jgi:hypothetical protein
VDFHEIPDDVEAGVAARTARAQFLGQEGRTYHTLLTEQSLRSNLGGTEIMRGQLFRLLEALELPGLTLGVIPARAELAIYPGTAFSIFGDKQVEIEAYHTCSSLTEKADIILYEKAFTALERSAVYGQQARALIEAELHALG